MKSQFFLKFIIGLCLLNVYLISGFAQEANVNQPPIKSETEVLGENERLPFMQAEEQNRPAEVGSASLLLRTFGAMLLIVGLIFFGAWGMKKLGFGASQAKLLSDAPELSVLTSISLGNGRTISSVKFGERILLVGSTAQSFTLLADENNFEENSYEEKVPKNPRSVAELLAEENEEDADFETEFSNAQKRLQFSADKGEQI